MKTSDPYHKWVEWSEEDQVYIGKCPDLITGIHGDNPTQVYSDLCEVIEDVIQHFIKEGWELPKPKIHPIRGVLNSSCFQQGICMSTNIQNYKKIVECIYGEDTITFDPNSQDTNNVIGALNSIQYNEFNKNFKARLRRIARSIESYPAIRNFALKAVNEIANKRNWDGAYAELTALDFFISTKIDLSKLELDKPSSASATLASHMGMSNVDHDFFIIDLDSYIDAKILSDKTAQIIKSSIVEAQQNLDKNFKIIPFYDIDISYADVQEKRKEIIQEIINFCTETAEKIAKKTITKDQVIPSLKSLVIPSLEFRIILSPGVYFGEKYYNPEKHADEHYLLLFQHAKKFHLSSPSLILFVHFPWASESIPPIDNANISFYKKLSLNFFEGHQLNENTKASEINPKFRTDISAIDVARNLTGIIFLEDKCILGDSQKESNIDAYFYINKNYLHNKIEPLVNFLENHAYAKNLYGSD